MARIVAAVAFRAIADRDYGAEYGGPVGFNDAAGAGLVGGDLKLPLSAGAVEQDEAVDPGLLAETLHHFGDESAVVLDHLVFERNADQVAFGQSGSVCRLQQGSHVVLRIKISAARARHYDRRGDPNRQAYSRAGEGRLAAASH
jgi:hypothetical protein